MFPVEVVHTPPEPGTRLDAHVARAVADAMARHPEGDALVFLPGAADIGRVHRRLTEPGALRRDVDVHRLFGALRSQDQDAALEPSPAGRRRVVLATDIAESSLTVAGVQIVIDAGLVRVPRYDPGSAMTRLHTEVASQASADQRTGRAGRTGPGVAYRLWEPSDHNRRPRQPIPEIDVADLTAMALEVAVWGAMPADLPLPSQPPVAHWDQAVTTLAALGAVDDDGRPTDEGRAMVALGVHPRLAAMALAAHRRGSGWTGVVLAAVLEERDVLRGHPDELPTDVTLRVELVADRNRRHPAVDRHAASSARRRAAQVARRLGVTETAVDTDMIGALVAVAYPDRIAQRSGGRSYRLRGGGGGSLPTADPLGSSEFLAVAALQTGRDGPQISQAAHLEPQEVQALVADSITEDTLLRWDDARNDVRTTRTRRAGALVLSTTDQAPDPGPETTAAFVEHIRATEGALLGWTDGDRALQARLQFLHRHDPAHWPDVGDDALLADLESWLVPMVPGLRSRKDLDRLSLAQALRGRLDHTQRNALDRLAPTGFTAGRTIAIDYRNGEPHAAARVQDLYGTTTHPTVLDGAVPVVISLLSPAGRPVQVTADLPGFWTGSWREVRKEMAGRYPKHPWPEDPANAAPPPPRRRS